jgi:hypothetical protein
MKVSIWFWQLLLLIGATLSARIVTEGLAPALVATAMERVYARRLRRQR